MLEGFPDFPLCYRERLRPCHPAPPVTSWPTAAAEHHSPFGPAPLQRLHPYYGLFCPCAPHRYSGPPEGCPVGRLPWHWGDRFSCSARKPVPGSRRLRAGCRMSRTPGHRSCLSRGQHHPRDINHTISTFHRRFAFARLPGPYLTGSSSRLFHDAHHHRSLRQQLVVV